MDWEDYRTFLAVARGGSFSAAARILSLDHTTIGRRIAALETALDLRLVDRLPRAVRLTAEGEKLAALGSNVEEAFFSVMRAASGAVSDLSGPVCISAPPSFVASVLAPTMPELSQRHPGLVVTLLGQTAAADLGQREADVALRLSRPEQAGLVARKLANLGFAFYAAGDYAHPETKWDFIGYDSDSAAIPQQRWLEARLAGRAIVLRTNDVASQASVAASGLGVALLPHFIGDRLSGLRRMASGDIPPSRELWMVVHADLRRAPRIRAVMDFLVDVLGKLSAPGNAA